MLRVESTLPHDTEHLIERVIACAITVHKAIGPGLLERICVRALSIELYLAGISFLAEQEFPVFYRGQLLCKQRVDLVVEAAVILEVKSIEAIGPIHRAQVLSCLHLSKIRVGLLMNFNVPVLKDGIKRIVL